MKHPPFILYFLVAASILPTGLQAALVINDPFLTGNSPASGEYAANTLLDEANPSTLNADGSWAAAHESSSFGAFHSIASGLGYAGLQTSDGAVQYSRVNSGGASVNKLAERSISTASPDVAVLGGPDLWASGLIQFDSQIERAFIAFDTVRAQDNSSLRPALGFGFQNGSAFLGTDTNISDITSGNTAGSFAADTTHFVLIKAEGGATDLISMWVNPDLSLGEAGLGAATLTLSYSIFNDGLNISEMGLVVSTSNSALSGASAIFDEVRAGTTFADVAPIPEPGSLQLLLAVGLAFIVFRKRRATI